MTVEEFVIETFSNFPKNLNTVVIFWKDPFGVLNKRTGFFEEYVEAEEFAKYLNSMYSTLDMPYAIYLNEKDVFASNPNQLLDARVN